MTLERSLRGKLRAEAVEGSRVGQRVVPEQEDGLFEARVGRELLDAEPANHEFPLSTIDAADACLRRDHTFEAGTERGWKRWHSLYRSIISPDQNS